MRNASIAALVVAAGIAPDPAIAQPTVAPSTETIGRSRGEDIDTYNVVHSFETGYRYHTVGGSRERYRSDVNFGNGVRLLGSSLRVHSKEGHGRRFDELVLNTQGLGNDPYQYSGLRLQHNTWYRYDLTWRLNEYQNPGLTTGTLGGHPLNTRRQMQDHDVTFLPQSSFKLFAGYSRNSQDGPGLTSVQLFDSRGDEFPVFAGINRRQTEHRLGAELPLFGFKFTVLRGWQKFRETTPSRLDGPSAGANPDDATTVRSLTRTEPYEGSTPFWRFLLFREKKDSFAAHARFSYAGGRRHFTFEELAAGTGRLGAAQNRQILVGGSGRRPVSTGALTLTFFPSGRLTLANHTAFHQIQMDGDSTFREFNNATQTLGILRFQRLAIRTVSNSTDLSVSASRRLNLFSGYRFSTRRIRSTEGFALDRGGDAFSAGQDNRIHSGLAGARLRLVTPVSLTFDAELGRADRPFYPISERDYHAVGARLQYKSRSVTLAAAGRDSLNTNSTSLFTHSARGRNYSFDASWSARSGLALDAGYSRTKLDTLSGMAYFALASLVQGDASLYASNIHAANLGLRLPFGNRTDLYLGYSRVQDTGDGRFQRSDPPAGRGLGSRFAAFRAAQTFPLVYDSPQARLSLRLHDKLRWNVGYQFYRYREDFQSLMNYRAHTGFSSVIWSF